PEGTSSSQQEIPMNELVPGDIIVLSAGNLIPGDVRLISAQDLFIDQSALTGESFPAEKKMSPSPAPLDNAFDHPNLCFMGSHVMSGKATALILATGANTFFGALAKASLQANTPSNFEKGLNDLSLLLIRFIVVMVVIILVINLFTKHNWLEALLFSLSVGVGLTPEMLPMIITTNLAKGAMAMAKEKVIVKRLNSIQNLGAMDVLCTDKTGTLTQNKIVLHVHLGIDGLENQSVIQNAYLNSFFQTGLKNLLDDAILQHATELDHLNIDQSYHLLYEMPFDFQRRRLSVVIETPEKTHLLICKGAVEEVMAQCEFAKNPDPSSASPQLALDAVLTDAITKRVANLNEDGFRVIALASKLMESNQTTYSITDETHLVLEGFIAFLDPPKESVTEALTEIKARGLSVKILTGDSEIITLKICKDVGLVVEGVLNGPQISTMDDAALDKVVSNITVFAKLNPTQKSRVIQALQQQQHVVGFLGDGINDSPALKQADVGISVDTGADIAKESADIILLEKDLMVLNQGILEGRKVFGNIIKYIRMTTSSNFGNVFSMVGASFLLPFLPMKPIQILTQNLLYDFSQTTLPLDNVDLIYLEKPRKWEIKNIRRFMLYFGPISSIFDYATFGILWFVLGVNTVGQQTLFQSGWFVEGLLSQTLVIHLIRTRKIPFFQSRASWPVILTTVSIIALGLYLPFSGMAPFLGLTPLPEVYFGWLLGILISYACLTQLMKTWFIKRFGYE
ncbi:MAG: magnesium-translocating P-type ATPase, partial [Cyanobacteria bacterium]|nr:magnesium-translocating P-type ATPase [Cyanobacteriota bacterium]